MEFIGKWIHLDLLKEPMNWAIVFVIATFWLLTFHVIMTAYNAMVAPAAQGAFGNPGQISIPNAAANFSQAGTLAQDPGGNLSAFYGKGGHIWTDGFESKYAEDGWTGDP